MIKRQKQKSLSILSQITIVSAYPVLLNIVALLGRQGVTKPHSVNELVFPIVLTTVFLIFLIATVILKISKNQSKSNSHIDVETKKTEASTNKYSNIIVMILLALTSILIRIPMIGTLQRWDAGEYIYSLGDIVRAYNFTFKSFVQEFTIAYHPNYGFCTFNSIPLFFDARNNTIITVWQIIFSVLAVMALYDIFRNKYEFREVRAGLSAMAVGSVPIFLGLSVYFTPDYYVALFFIYAMYFEAKEEHILEAFMIILMCLSKENCALIVLGYYGVKLLYSLFKEGFLKTIKTKDFWVPFSSAVLLVVSMVIQGGSWISKTNAKSGSSISVGLNKIYILVKLKQYLLSNFAWILSIIFAVGYIYILVKKKWKNYPSKEWVSLIGIIVAMCLYALFGLLVHIASHERYNTIFAMLLAFIAFIVLNYLVKSSKVIVPILSVISILFVIESFVTIDPVTQHIFWQVDIGEDNKMTFESESIQYFGDGLVTNYQYAWIDKSFDQMLRTVDYKTDEAIYFPDVESDGGSGLQFDGNSGSYQIGWSEDKQRREFFDQSIQGFAPINKCTVYADRKNLPYVQLPYADKVEIGYTTSKAYLCLVPYFREKDVEDGLYLDAIQEYYYKIDDCKSTAYRGTIYYYPLIIKDKYLDKVSLDLVISHINRAKGKNDSRYIDLDRIRLSDMNDAELSDIIERLYKFEISKHLFVKDVNYEQRRDVEELDSIYFTIELYDQSGNRIPLPHDGKQMEAKAGAGQLIDEIDDAVVDMRVGEPKDIEFTVDDYYPELEAYAGQVLKARVNIDYIACSCSYQRTDEEMIEAHQKSVEDICNRCKLESASDILKKNTEEYLQKKKTEESSSLLEADSSAGLKMVEEYYSNYLNDRGISEEEFIKDALVTDDISYEEAKEILAISQDEIIEANKEIDKRFDTFR